MISLKKAVDINRLLQQKKQLGHSVGFVPTMGALHPGHLSLVAQALEENDHTVCSIFVNPTQFDNARDFELYPVTLEKDLEMLEKAGTDFLFLPSTAEIYPSGTESTHHYDLGYLETILEGKFRPGHYQGVCQVVDRLLEIIQPTRLYLGQKDYQQCMVIQRLVDLKNAGTKIKIIPTEREKDGLAMSSRNARLSEEHRRTAAKIAETLLFIKSEIKPGNTAELRERGIRELSDAGFKVEYVEIADAETLRTVEEWNGLNPLVALIAAFLGEVRLIDNMLLNNDSIININFAG